MLRHGVAEITAAAPVPGEDAELRATASRLAHADDLRLAARTAHDALLGDADDPASYASDVATLLGIARRSLDMEAADDPALGAMRDRIDRTSCLGRATWALIWCSTARFSTPIRPGWPRSRIAALVLTRLTRKYGPELTDVLAWAQEAERQLVDLDVSDEALAALAAERDALAARDREAGQRAVGRTTQRRRSTRRLDNRRTRRSCDARGASDRDRRVANPGRGRLSADRRRRADRCWPRRARRGRDPAATASRRAGPACAARSIRGELSRVMLAIEVCLGAAGKDVPTLVFDEVDAGVGGRAAVEVGRRLARLAQDYQVIVVTHLPQVAAYADQHVVIDKPEDSTNRGVSAVRIVDGADRVAELARMLAGSDTETARQHAAELLTSAAADLADDSTRIGRSPARR